jgi:hypothetical protein
MLLLILILFFIFFLILIFLLILLSHTCEKKVNTQPSRAGERVR